MSRFTAKQVAMARQLWAMCMDHNAESAHMSWKDREDQNEQLWEGTQFQLCDRCAGQASWCATFTPLTTNGVMVNKAILIDTHTDFVHSAGVIQWELNLDQHTITGKFLHVTYSGNTYGLEDCWEDLVAKLNKYLPCENGWVFVG